MVLGSVPGLLISDENDLAGTGGMRAVQRPPCQHPHCVDRRKRAFYVIHLDEQQGKGDRVHSIKSALDEY